MTGLSFLHARDDSLGKKDETLDVSVKHDIKLIFLDINERIQADHETSIVDKHIYGWKSCNNTFDLLEVADIEFHCLHLDIRMRG